MFERSGLISVTDHLGHLFLLFLSFKFQLLCLNSPTKRDPWKPSPLPPQWKQTPKAPLSAGNLGLAVWPGLLRNFQVPSVENLCVLKDPPTVTAEGVLQPQPETAQVSVDLRPTQSNDNLEF